MIKKKILILNFKITINKVWLINLKKDFKKRKKILKINNKLIQKFAEEQDFPMLSLNVYNKI